MEISPNAKEKYEELAKIGDVHIVPSVNIRCLVPCEFGYCVCSRDINFYGKQFTIVNDEGKKRALQELNSELTYVKRDFLREIKS